MSVIKFAYALVLLITTCLTVSFEESHLEFSNSYQTVIQNSLPQIPVLATSRLAKKHQIVLLLNTKISCYVHIQTLKESF